jgi:sugar (pentulose or hexulose) kinase
VTPQIIADITGLPLNCYGQNTGSPLGAAIVARGLREPQRSLADLANEMLGPARRVEPGQNASFYSARFAEYMGSLPFQQTTTA